MEQGMTTPAKEVTTLSNPTRGPGIPSGVPEVKLFDELDYRLPGLVPVKVAVDAGDLTGAKAALLAHFRARPDAQERPRRDPAYDTHLADNILEGRYIWGDTVCTYGPKTEDIAWYRVPEGVYWPLFDHGWAATPSWTRW
ncbi:MAG: hypothetical protein EXS64_14170 [Candidatus Latescibacteria bacterium]|nr:hypothetical protein [Candidatus Latescibacterota bacterium]